MSVLMELAIFPTDKGGSVGAAVGRVVEMIRDSGVVYQVTAMGTLVETPTLAEALDIVQRAHDVLAGDASRIYATVKLDIRKGDTGRIYGKVRSVTDRIGSVNT
jgi:uncharacterized protein (TIGR00106 family)